VAPGQEAGAGRPLEEVNSSWQTTATDEGAAQALSRDTGLPPAATKVLVSRDIRTAEQAERFLNPRLSEMSDPFLLPDMDRAVDRIWEAIDGKQRIAVYGDYDADGITGTALLVKVLRSLGGDVRHFIPSRLEDGYGLTVDALTRCLEAHEPALLVTVDCGTGSSKAVAVAGRAGTDVVVTDHHEVAAETDGACAVVNPKRHADDATPLAGVGVVFKLCHALLRRGIADQRPVTRDVDLREHLDIAAIGTVADVVPLLGENRIIVRHGLDRMNPPGSVGLKGLFEVARITGDVDSYHVGFIIGPRLNAAGRMGSPEPALELLLTTDESRARSLSSELDKANTARKRTEDKVLQEVIEEVESYFDGKKHFGISAGRPGWHLGTLGIVASRVCSRYQRPAMVIGFDGDGVGRGSCRSNTHVDIMEVLSGCSDLLVSFGGHRMAGGIAIEASRLDEFRARFNELCAVRMEGADTRPVMTVDAWISLEEADELLFQALKRMRPFGLGNPAPTWGVKNARFVGRPRIVGNNHLKAVIAGGAVQMEAIAFGMGDSEIPDGPIDLLFQLQENVFRGRRILQMNVKDFRATVG